MISRIICSSMMSDLNGTKFTLEVPSTQAKLHFKFTENPSQDTSNKHLKKFFILSYSSFTVNKSCYNMQMHLGRIHPV